MRYVGKVPFLRQPYLGIMGGGVNFMGVSWLGVNMVFMLNAVGGGKCGAMMGIAAAGAAAGCISG